MKITPEVVAFARRHGMSPMKVGRFLDETEHKFLLGDRARPEPRGLLSADSVRPMLPPAIPPEEDA